MPDRGSGIYYSSINKMEMISCYGRRGILIISMILL